MVGVPGKYKGCHTCRTRRVKCDMGRPTCKKCADSNRVCEGYEKQMTFIVSGPNQLGRCSSHPHRSILKANTKKNDAPLTRRRTSAPESVSLAPSSRTNKAPKGKIVDANNNMRLFSHTNSLALHPHYDNEVDVSFTLSTLAPTLPVLDPPHAGQELCLRAFTFVEDIRRQSDDGDANPRARKRHTKHSQTSALCKEEEEAKTLYVFSSINETIDEYNFEHIGGTLNQVKLQGPAAFLQPPTHHFFARMWRPLAITHALRQQQNTFLEHDVWCTGPFEKTDKSAFDKLWDVVARVPGICERAHRTIDTTNKTSVNYSMRAKKAQDLLKNGCGQTQVDFDAWLQDLQDDVDESKEQSSLYWPVPSSKSIQSSASTPSTFSAHQFRDAETAQLLVTYWSTLITFHQKVSQLLVVAEQSAQKGGGFHSQLAYRPSAPILPAYNSSNPPASMPNISATSSPANIDTSDYSSYSLPNNTQPYTYNTSTSGTSFNLQYASNIFLPQPQTPYINFHPETYPTTTGYLIPSAHSLDPGFPTLFDTTMNMNMLPGQPENSFNFNDLEYLNANSEPSYFNPNQTGYLPPPQRSHTPSSYISVASAPGSQQSNISAPGSNQSHQSPANSFVSSAAASHVGSHAATPPDSNTSHTTFNQQLSPSADVYTGQFPSFYQNSRPENLVHLAKLIGSALDFLLNTDNEVDATLLLWPLEVLEGMCTSTDERIHCGKLRNELRSRAERIGRWVRGRRWRVEAVGGEE